MELTYKENVENVIGCLEYLMERVGDLILENNEASLSEDEMVCEDAKQALEFLHKLESITEGACVLAVYCGRDEEKSNADAYGFGADSYEYCAKYVEGALQLADSYGTEDFYDKYWDYAAKNIVPNRNLEG